MTKNSYQTAAHCVAHKYTQVSNNLLAISSSRHLTQENAYHEALHTAMLLFPTQTEKVGDHNIFYFTDGSAADISFSGVSVIAEAKYG